MNVTVRVLDGHLAIGRQEEDQVLLLDRPVRTGGTGLGFNGGHLMLMGWAACFKSTLLAAAESRGIEVRRLELSVAGETADRPYRFVELTMKARLEISGSDQEREHLLEIAGRGCAVSNTLRQGAKLTISLEGETGLLHEEEAGRD
ncbi:MAG TPA: OsmC family protein [Acidimicrobiales bacterium]|nr:OsmC family protein [Acidimicrobiales bacterium]